MRGRHGLRARGSCGERQGIRGCQPTNLIVAVYGEGVVVVGLVFEFGIIGAKAEGVGVMRTRRRGGNGRGSGVFWVSSHL